MPDSTAAAGRIAVIDEPFVPGGAFASIDIVAADAVSSPSATAEDSRHALHADERALADTMSPTRRASFVAGRRALRAAVRHVAPDLETYSLLRTHRGAPNLPVGVTGSISHKRTRAIAVAAAHDGMQVGVDLEELPGERDLSRPSIADRILTEFERDAISALDPLPHREATLVRFALKEAVYKSIDPYVERYVRFTEVELDVHVDGRATVRLLLPELGTNDVILNAHWRIKDRWIIAMASSARA